MSIFETGGTSAGKPRQTSDTGLPQVVRDDIIKRAAAALVRVRQEAAQQVADTYSGLDSRNRRSDRPDTSARAVDMNLEERAANLKRTAVKLAVRAVLEKSYLSKPVKSLLEDALRDDRKLDELIPLARVQASHTALTLRDKGRRRRMVERPDNKTR